MTDHRTLEAKKKTALQLHIDQLQIIKMHTEENSRERKAINLAIKSAYILLPTERQQIEEAVKHGKSFGQHMTPSDYFTSTYETP